MKIELTLDAAVAEGGDYTAKMCAAMHLNFFEKRSQTPNQTPKGSWTSQ